MIGLWRKDLPWMLLFAIGGTVTIGTMLCDGGDLFGMFVVGSRGVDEVLVLSGLLGLAVGVVASVWDLLLGTREYLAQRPVSPARLATARIGAAMATAGVFVVAGPVFGRISCNAWSPEPLFEHWSLVPELIAYTSNALSMAAVALCALALPIRALVRVLLLPVLCLVVACAILLLEKDQPFSTTRYLGTRIVVAAVLSTVAWLGLRRRYDPDRAWSPAERRGFGSVALLAVAPMTAALVVEYQQAWCRDVQGAYPRVAIVGGERAVLVLPHDEDPWASQMDVVDGRHARTGEHVADGEIAALMRADGGTGSLRFDAPRRRGGRRSDEFGCRRDGVLFHLDRNTRRIARIRFGSDRDTLPRDWSIGGVEDFARDQEVPVAAQPGSGRARVLDREQRVMVPVELPEGDVFTSFGGQRHRHLRGLPAGAEREGGDYLRLLSGRDGSYVLSAGRWVRVVDTESRSLDRRQRRVLVRVGSDPLRFVAKTDFADGEPRFEHTFEPRTARERWLAFGAMAVSTLRLPPLQVYAHLGDQHGVPASPWHDPLVAQGRRTGLLAAQLAVAALCVWLVRRRLRRVGAPAQAVRFWMIATA
ncbi:MAG: hypothetical protein KAI24_13755, partial [Planctomycetes bacterium]|nr:hypothetical protein [Planctomycetota bacterium]